eukprot:gnl/MRDRNA2_/MRDRNA2_30928_c0_seq1.p1 gnl/MRDRNA2_/MRDRNA2_30928_c0~~gnl/MRDRNA2_/MRDRNA2_30928_c0_seq1.p1  ORF type:complete len:381 (+),score=43.34 gnl/MRDRNA2_/MRDRNA2_30928_c0_seq1:55-1197(+)
MGWWCLGSVHENEGLEYPPYWHRSEAPLEDNFEELHTADVGRERVQELINETFRSTISRDRRTRMPNSLQVIGVVRMENAKLWKKYAAKREKIRKARRCQKHQSKSVPPTAPPNTQGSLHCLDDSVHESYLFHGTSANSALQIQRKGFRLDMARRGIFGRGIYFAEAASKADEYAGDHDSDFYVMLLARVVRGETRHLQQVDSNLHWKLNRRKFDSVLGDRKAAVGTYREYVMYDESQIYPEYAVIYRRIFSHCPGMPPLIVRPTCPEACIDQAALPSRMVMFRDSGGTRLFPVPPECHEYFCSIEGCHAKAIDCKGAGIDVLLIDSTGDGELDIRMMAVRNQNSSAAHQDYQRWRPIPRSLELPCSPLWRYIHCEEACC